MKKLLLVFVLIHVLAFFSSYAQNEPTDCVNAITICGDTNLDLNSNGFGINDFSLPGNNRPSCIILENQSLWIKVNIVQSGTLAFIITPESPDPAEDYDFAIYGPNLDCSNLGSPIRCSFAFPNYGTITGLRDAAADLSENAFGDGFVRSIDALTGEEYYILIDNFLRNNQGFNIEFTGTATLPDYPVNEAAINSTNLDLSKCDDTGDLNDGLSTFNLDSNTPLIQGSQTNVIITYHNTEEDASVGANPLSSPYSNIERIERIYVRVENVISECFAVDSFTLTVFDEPQIIVPSSFILCDNDDDGTEDGVTEIDLTQFNNQILTGSNSTNLSISYFQNIEDALSESNSITTYTNSVPYTQGQDVVFVRVENSINQCASINQVQIFLNRLPDILIEEEYFLCQNQTEIIVDAGLPPGTDPSLFNYLWSTNDQTETISISQSGTYMVTVTNAQTGCSKDRQVQVFLNRPPDILVEEEYFLCQNQTEIIVDAGLPPGTDPSLFNYLWSSNDQTETISISQSGTYMVTVTNAQTGCSKDRVVEVIASEAPLIQSIEVNDERENNTITINAQGEGDYEYAIEIDGVISSYQDNPTFTNVPPGFHIVYVRDKNGCLPITTQNISVIGVIPKYFTPNGDGFHETWNAEGASNQILSGSLIYIFDRHSKLIKQVRIGGNGWDGTFNGRPMPSSEYWYRIELEDGRTLTGSFSLIR